MAFDEYKGIVEKVNAILGKCETTDIVNLDELESAVQALKELPNEAFTGEVNKTHASRIAVKEMHDFASSIKRFCDVYKYTRKDYYEKSADYYKTHSGMLTHQQSIFEQLYKFGTGTK